MAYRKISAEIRLQEERQRQYDALVGEHLNYPIIRDLINSAANGILIKLMFKDGTSMEIKRDETIPAEQFKSDLF